MEVRARISSIAQMTLSLPPFRPTRGDYDILVIYLEPPSPIFGRYLIGSPLGAELN